MADIKPIPVPTGRYLDRVAARLAKYIDWPEDADDCWLWTGTLNTQGYARTSVRRTGDPSLQRDTATRTDQRIVQAHRLMWALWHGDTDKPLDHICEVRNCVNPNHLRETTTRANTLRSKTSPVAVNARRTHCKAGHPFAGENLYVEPSGRRRCRTCMARRSAEWKEKVDYGHNGAGTRTFRRKDRTECVNGHPATEANTYVRKSGRRECRVCHRERSRV